MSKIRSETPSVEQTSCQQSSAETACPVIRITDGVCRMPEWCMGAPVCFESCRGEHIAIVGPNAGGKSKLVSMITGRYPLLGRPPFYDFRPSTKPLVSDNIRHIAFLDAYGGDSDRTYFLQQRWNQMEIGSNAPTVRAKLEEAYRCTGGDTPQRRALQRKLYDIFHIEPLLDKYTMLLSGGELRKFKLTETLLAAPRVLIMDNPFIGLDAPSRCQLRELFATLAQEQYLQIILVLSKADDIPPFITHVVEVKDGIVYPKQTLKTYQESQKAVPQQVLGRHLEEAILHLPYKSEEYNTHEVVNMRNVSIRYGRRTILDSLTWKVCNGERWALSGQNGAGKSTLLSLICADNPQGYACDIALFGHPRGSGESIWDIKKHIGYVSPEMHRAYKRDLPAIHIVASGLKDSVGLYVRPHESEYDICRFWMEVFGIKALENKTFMKLSGGEQRLVLLARAFVKDPELLILDEPLHGLDNVNRRLVQNIIDAFCQRKNKTLIMVTHYENEFPKCIDHQLKLKRQ